jgi:hypothetical protein
MTEVVVHYLPFYTEISVEIENIPNNPKDWG